MQEWKELDPKELIYNNRVFFKEEERQKVFQAHYEACFEESFREHFHAMNDQKSLDLYNLVQETPVDILRNSFPRIKCEDDLKLRHFLFRCYAKNVFPWKTSKAAAA